MNWDALGKLVGWLPGAAVGGLVGGLLAGLSFDSFASQCPVGEPYIGIGGVLTQLSQECVQSPVGDLGLAGYLGALAFFGAVVGALIHAGLHGTKGRGAAVGTGDA